MNCVICPDSTMTRNQKEILDLQANLYKELYTSDPDITFTFCNYGTINSVTVIEILQIDL